jgi:hypothetical protein
MRPARRSQRGSPGCSGSTSTARHATRGSSCPRVRRAPKRSAFSGTTRSALSTPCVWLASTCTRSGRSLPSSARAWASARSACQPRSPQRASAASGASSSAAAGSAHRCSTSSGARPSAARARSRAPKSSASPGRSVQRSLSRANASPAEASATACPAWRSRSATWAPTPSPSSRISQLRGPAESGAGASVRRHEGRWNHSAGSRSRAGAVAGAGAGAAFACFAAFEGRIQ